MPTWATAADCAAQRERERAQAARDEERAVALMQSHLEHVEASLTFDRKRPASDLAAALAS
mgnify:CR=1 FL=1